MATIRKRNGKFQVQIRIKGSQSVTRTFKTKTEATIWSKTTEVEKYNNPVSHNKDCTNQETVGSLLERYYIEVLSKRPWYSRECSILRRFQRSDIYNIRIEDLCEGDIARYRDQRLKSVKPATVVRELSIGSHCMTTAQGEWGIRLPTNAFKSARKPKVRNSRERRISQEEWNRIVESDRQRGRRSMLHIIELAIETAMRKGELLNAKWTDVDFSQSTLHIPKTKNEYPRTIPLTPKAINIIKSIVRTDNNNNIITVNYFTLNSWWVELLKAAGIRNLRWHDLRHEGISRHFEYGLSVPEVAMISGHRDYQMLRRYTHIKPANVAAKLAMLFNKDS
ncbi:site-specific integrase [Methylobacterium pseudosasicola]|uniref:Site-specific recombinase XerD n=1 Tax=Methylobacterium pseudosasicola TaxID=582667 RepID=A0A1I4RP15_9HYPH|nr:site-specific integrase [Methylobacterium pseudosasicola]SFM53965.1 Site-specific recombinase XerD [Methylobacterium pseudosasicola]